MQIYYRKYRKIKRTKIIQSVLSPENKHVKHFVVFSLSHLRFADVTKLGLFQNPTGYLAFLDSSFSKPPVFGLGIQKDCLNHEINKHLLSEIFVSKPQSFSLKIKRHDSTN